MSNIYIQEPPTSGKVILDTTVGPIDIELWAKETPKACRNFVQLALEGYYNGTIFHRVIKGMCVQGGDPTGTGEGGDSIYGKPFKDEVHSRLRFNRRGLVAMASGDKNDNTSQFFFTLGASPHLNGKHTIFGKVAGETVFNMLKLEEGDVDEDDKPEYPQKIRSVEVVDNPFPDIVPRRKETPNAADSTRTEKPKKTAAKKDFKLLSFGHEAEEEDCELTEINEKQYRGKSKSIHDLVKDDKTLSSDPVVVIASSHSSKQKSESVEDDSSGRIGRIREKLHDQSKKSRRSENSDRKNSDLRDKTCQKESDDDEPDVHVENYFEEERKRKAHKEAEEHRKEYKQLRKEMKATQQNTAETAANSKHKPSERDAGNNDWLASYYAEQDAYSKSTTANLKKAGKTNREAQTLAMVAKFKSSLLHSINAEGGSGEDDEEKWVARELRFEDQSPVLAKDATTQKEEMYDITDPRHPLNARKRQKSTLSHSHSHGHSDKHRSRR